MAKKTTDDYDVAGFMSAVMDGTSSDEFYYYEPWDVDSPAPDIRAEGFQVAYHMSQKKLRMSIAGNRVGKTQKDGIEAIIMMTGEIPVAMRYPAGHKTDVARHDTPENRARWGFLDPKTGEWTPPVKFPQTPKPEWAPTAPCGYIIGAGIFPQQKISRRKNDSVWICTYKTTKDERWIKFMADTIPRQFLDTRYSETGYNGRKEKFCLTNGNEITFITYERGPERAQGANVFAVFMDEEPKLRKFWTEVDQRLIGAVFDGWMSMSFTPLLGLSWSYEDLFQPIIDGRVKNAAIFHATQYDSPYISTATVDSRKNKYKAWEIQARVYGRYSEMTGRPYFDYEKLMGGEGTGGWMQNFVPRGRKCRILPTSANETYLREMLGVPMRCEPAVDMADTNWELYEGEPNPEETYFISADCAEGAELEEDATDRNTAWVFRFPHKDEDQAWPVLVAMLRTSVQVTNFARLLWYGATHWNYAFICPEVSGKYGGVLAAEMKDWPFVYHSTQIRDKNQKTKEVWGMETTSKNRTVFWDLVGDYINSHDSVNCIRSGHLLKECCEAIYGKDGRPDHPSKGTSDCVMGYGIGLYVYRHDRFQVANNFGCSQAFRRDTRDVRENRSIFADRRRVAPDVRSMGLGQRTPRDASMKFVQPRRSTVPVPGDF